MGYPDAYKTGREPQTSAESYAENYATLTDEQKIILETWLDTFRTLPETMPVEEKVRTIRALLHNVITHDVSVMKSCWLTSLEFLRFLENSEIRRYIIEGDNR